MRRNSAFWAVILIIAGVVLLAGNLGLFDRLNVNVWNLLWPLFLIALGLWFIAGTFLRPRRLEVEQAVIPLDGATRASIEIGHGAGELVIGPGAGAGELMAGAFAGGVERRVRRDGSTLDVELKVPAAGIVFPWGWTGGAFDWDLRLSEGVPIELECKTGANRARLDLATLQVVELELDTGASSTDVALPAHAGFTRVKIESGAASVNVRVPGGVAARIHSGGALARIEVDPTRFPPAGDNRYESPDYATAANRAEITIQTGVGSVTVM